MFVWPVIALVGILSAVWFFGFRNRAAIGDADALRRWIREGYPDVVPGDVMLDPDGLHALVSDVAGTTLIVVFSFGSQLVSRLLSPDVVRRVEATNLADGGRHFTLLLHDIGCPRISLSVRAGDVACWSERLERLVAVPTHVVGR